MTFGCASVPQDTPTSERDAGDDDLLLRLAATRHPLPALVETLLAAPGPLDYLRSMVDNYLRAMVDNGRLEA